MGRLGLRNAKARKRRYFKSAEGVRIDGWRNRKQPNSRVGPEIEIARRATGRAEKDFFARERTTDRISGILGIPTRLPRMRLSLLAARDGKSQIAAAPAGARLPGNNGRLRAALRRWGYEAGAPTPGIQETASRMRATFPRMDARRL